MEVAGGGVVEVGVALAGAEGGLGEGVGGVEALPGGDLWLKCMHCRHSYAGVSKVLISTELYLY